jgi:hypothetical protein
VEKRAVGAAVWAISWAVQRSVDKAVRTVRRVAWYLRLGQRAAPYLAAPARWAVGVAVDIVTVLITAAATAVTRGAAVGGRVLSSLEHRLLQQHTR